MNSVSLYNVALFANYTNSVGYRTTIPTITITLQILFIIEITANPTFGMPEDFTMTLIFSESLILEVAKR